MKLKNLISGVFLLGVFATTTVNAQSAPMPQAPKQQKVDVKDAELEKYAEVFQQMRMVQQEAQKEMIQVVENENIELKRFNEIHQASMNPNAEVETTPEEDKKYKAVVAELQTLQPKFQKEMEEVIANSDMTMERYQQLAMALRTDTDLQQRLQKIMQS